MLITSADDRAGRAFEKAAEIQSDKLNEKMDAANSLQEASKMYRKNSPQDAARTLAIAIKYFTENGSFRRAATFMQTLAEIYEQDLSDINKAKESYETAAGWFEDDNAVAYVFNVLRVSNAQV
jgi:alpha-soluble NSF attachment protein